MIEWQYFGREQIYESVIIKMRTKRKGEIKNENKNYKRTL